jgi:hypothetical protein
MRFRGSVCANRGPGENCLGGDEDCLAPLQLSFRGPCSSLAVFGRKAGVIHHLLMALACDFKAMDKNLCLLLQTLLPHQLPSRYQQPHSIPQASHHSLHPVFISLNSIFFQCMLKKHTSFRAIAVSGKPHEITSKMGLENDTRGWIMTCISGVACVIGASIVCIDIVVRQFPGMEKFSIAESDAFLSASLSLSFGVMVGNPVGRREH